ncbi:hypothetical protein J6590_087624, partial [Homalodisca vitripennis]
KLQPAESRNNSAEKEALGVILDVEKIKDIWKFKLCADTSAHQWFYNESRLSQITISHMLGPSRGGELRGVDGRIQNL